MQYIKIHSLDNVAVALADLAEGTEVTFDNQSVTLRQAIGRGHKFALIPIAKGENVVKYGLPIGHALADIAPGEYIHSHNTRTNLSDLDEYSYQPDFQPEEGQAADREVLMMLKAPTACICSATPTVVPSWATTTSIPAPCCKTWCATRTRARCW